MTASRAFAVAIIGAMLASPLMAAEPPAAAAPAPAASAFSDAQKAEIEKIVRGVIEKNPEIVIESIQAQQRKQAEEADKKASEALVKLKDKLLEDAKDPFEGNAKGTIRIVEFFDYNCGFCKKAHDPLKELIKSEKDVKIIYKQFPILSDASKLQAKAALAAQMQGKYMPMHDALMTGHVSDEAAIMTIAGKIGLNKDKLKKDMESPVVAARLAADQELAKQIGAHGTPTFIFEDKLVPGAMSVDEMKKVVADIRAKKKG